MFVLENIKESNPDRDNFLKLVLSKKCMKVLLGMREEVRQSFIMVERLLSLVLISPSSRCSAKQYFVALRSLKTLFHPTMLQTMLNSLFLCHFQEDELNRLSHTEVMHRFICNNTQKGTFGLFEYFLALI